MNTLIRARIHVLVNQGYKVSEAKTAVIEFEADSSATDDWLKKKALGLLERESVKSYAIRLDPERPMTFTRFEKEE